MGLAEQPLPRPRQLLSIQGFQATGGLRPVQPTTQLLCAVQLNMLPPGRSPPVFLLKGPRVSGSIPWLGLGLGIAKG